MKCQHRLSWHPEWRCRNRTPFRYCVAHWLERARIEWHRAPFYGSLDLSNINRPYLNIDDDRPMGFVGLSWGNTNGDPVWRIGWEPAHPWELSDDQPTPANAPVGPESANG